MIPQGVAKRILPGEWDPVVRRSLLLLCAVVVFGTAGYTWIEGWSPWRSLFFTLVTLTTVGYGDYGLTENGERFTAVLMIGGIGTVSYTAGLILQNIMARATHPERRMIEKARKLQDHHIICGLGRTGERVITKLLEDGAAVVAIDSDPHRVAEAQTRGIVAFEGDATSDQALQDAGIERASAVAAVTSADAVNALICLTARALAPKVPIIARAEDEPSICKLRRAGATNVISPSSYGGDGIAENMLRPEVARLLPGLQGGTDALSFAQIAISPQSPHLGEAIIQLGKRHPRLAIVAIRDASGDVTTHPEPAHTLALGEVLVVAGTGEDVAELKTAA